MYKLYGTMFHNSSNENSFGIQLFSLEKSNFLFVAETDNFFKILRFLPITNTENFYTTNAYVAKRYSMSDNSPIPSITRHFGTIFEELEFYMRNYSLLDTLVESPVFRVQLSRIVGNTHKDKRDLFSNVKEKIFRNISISNTWQHIESVCSLEDEYFWRQKNEDEYSSILRENGIERIDDILIWLRRAKNFENRNWLPVWRKAKSNFPFKQELALISAAWFEKMALNMADVELIWSTYEVAQYLAEADLYNDEFYPLFYSFQNLVERDDNALSFMITSEIAAKKMRSLFAKHGDWDAVSKIDHISIFRGFDPYPSRVQTHSDPERDERYEGDGR